MPTANPRIAITVQPHRYDLLKRLAALQGVSMASMVTELMDEFYPVLERVCVALERAKQAQEVSLTGLKESAEIAMARIMPLTAEANGQLDLLLSEIEQRVSASEKPAAVDANPRVVTRGSGPKKVAHSKGGKKASNPVTKGVKAK